jgi:hypothetical protein
MATPALADRWPDTCPPGQPSPDCIGAEWPGPNPPTSVQTGTTRYELDGVSNPCAPGDGTFNLYGTETSNEKQLTGTYPGFFPPIHELQDHVVIALTGTAANGTVYRMHAQLSGIVLLTPTFSYHETLVSNGGSSNAKITADGSFVYTTTCTGGVTPV